jgi:hypothetical protein
MFEEHMIYCKIFFAILTIVNDVISQIHYLRDREL